MMPFKIATRLDSLLSGKSPAHTQLLDRDAANLGSIRRRILDQRHQPGRDLSIFKNKLRFRALSGNSAHPVSAWDLARRLSIADI